MADMPTDFWGGWIAIITLVSLVGLGWLIFSVYFVEETPDEKAGGPLWDENLREGAHPAPLWWFWLILILMVFSVIYLMLYPGLGSYAGALKWSQGGRLNDSMIAYNTEFGGQRRLIAEAQIATLQANEALMASAQRVFDRNCAVCHGYDGRGLTSHFPDLTDAEWQWGGSPAQVEQSIRLGRTGVMVGWSQILGEVGVSQVADYVKALSRGNADNHPGRAQYDQFCLVCHGAGGAGNEVLGASNLIDDISLYGNSDEALEYSIAVGRMGLMPAFDDRLDETQIKLLVSLLTRDARGQ